MWETLLRPVDRAVVDRFAATFVLVAGVGVTLLTNGVRLAQPRDVPARLQAVDAAAPRPRPVRLRADVQRDLGRHDPALLRRHVRRVGGHLHAGDTVDRDDRHRRRTRRRRDRVVGDRAGVRRPSHIVAAVAAVGFAAWAGVQRVRQRHPSTAAVARLPLRRHHPRTIVAHDVVATGRPRARRDPVRVRHAAVRFDPPEERVEQRAGEQRPVRSRPALHRQRARHGAGGVHRHLDARRAVVARRRWCSGSPTPAR